MFDFVISQPNRIDSKLFGNIWPQTRTLFFIKRSKVARTSQHQHREARTINVNVGSFFSRFYWCANAPTTSCFKNVEIVYFE